MEGLLQLLRGRRSWKDGDDVTEGGALLAVVLLVKGATAPKFGINEFPLFPIVWFLYQGFVRIRERWRGDGAARWKSERERREEYRLIERLEGRLKILEISQLTIVWNGRWTINGWSNFGCCSLHGCWASQVIGGRAVARAVSTLGRADRSEFGDYTVVLRFDDRCWILFRCLLLGSWSCNDYLLHLIGTVFVAMTVIAGDGGGEVALHSRPFSWRIWRLPSCPAAVLWRRMRNRRRRNWRWGFSHYLIWESQLNHSLCSAVARFHFFASEWGWQNWHPCPWHNRIDSWKFGWRGKCKFGTKNFVRRTKQEELWKVLDFMKNTHCFDDDLDLVFFVRTTILSIHFLSPNIAIQGVVRKLKSKIQEFSSALSSVCSASTLLWLWKGTAKEMYRNSLGARRKLQQGHCAKSGGTRCGRSIKINLI